MNVILLMITTGLRRHNVRRSLAVLAIAGAAALLMVGLGSRDIVAERSSEMADKVMGRFEVAIVPSDEMHPELPPELVDAVLKSDVVTDVQRVNSYNIIIYDERDISYLPELRADMIAGEWRGAPFDLRDGKWLSAEAKEEAVVSGGLADRWKVNVGDTLRVEAEEGEWELLIVGISDEIVANQQLSGVFVHPKTARQVAGEATGEERLLLAVKPGADISRLMDQLRDKAEESKAAPVILDRQAVAESIGVNQVQAGLDIGALLGAVLGLIAAVMIIGATFYADIEQRIASLRMLRAIGAGRSQIFFSVLGEAALLGLGGAVLGTALGIAGIQLLISMRPELFPDYILPSAASLGISLMAPMVTAMLAATLPAFRAARLSPLDQPAATADTTSRAPLLSAVLAAVGFTGAFVIYNFAESAWSIPVVLLLILVTFILSIPAALAVVEGITTLSFSRYGATADLLRRQVTGAWRRSSVMVLLLAICLTLFVAAQVWGRSMLKPYLPVQDLPSRIVSVLPSGLPPSTDKEIYNWEGVKDNRAVAMAARQTRLTSSMTENSNELNASNAWVLVLAIDPQRAFSGDQPILQPGFTKGAPENVLRQLKKGGCLTTPALLDRLGLDAGDSIELTDPDDPEQHHSLPIVAAAQLPGWQWISTFTRMRDVKSETIAPVVVSRSIGAELFGLKNSTFYALYPAEDISTDQIYKYFDTQLVRSGGGDRGDRSREADDDKAFIRLADMDAVMNQVTEHAGTVIWLISAVPMLELFFALIGVVGATIVTVRVREYQFGVLRGMGATRGQIVGLLTGETAIIGITAIILSLITGIAMAAVTLEPGLQKFGVGGESEPLVIPYLTLAGGCAVQLTAVLITAVLTARQVVSKEVSSQLARLS